MLKANVRKIGFIITAFILIASCIFFPQNVFAQTEKLSMRHETEESDVKHYKDQGTLLLSSEPTPSIMEAQSSTNALLSSVSLSGNPWVNAEINNDTNTITATVTGQSKSVNITPQDSLTTFVMKDAGGTIIPYNGNASVTLNVGANTFTIETTAEDGITKKTYAMTITRSLSSDANLNQVSFSGVAPVYADIDNEANTITATVTGQSKQIYISPLNYYSTTFVMKDAGGTIIPYNYYASVTLNVGANTFTIETTAEDGITKKTYTMTITRSLSSNADLNHVSIISGNTPVSADIDNDANTITATVTGRSKSVNITPQESSTTFVIKDAGGTIIPYNTYSATVTLNVGANTFTIETTADDGITKKTYTMTITRSISSNAALNQVSFYGGDSVLADIDNDANTITATVIGRSQSVFITPQDSLTTFVIKNAGGTIIPYNYSANVILNVGANTFTIDTTAEDGITKKTYTMTITRSISSDANLNQVSLGYPWVNAEIDNDANTITASVTGHSKQINIYPHDSSTKFVIKDAGGTIIPFNYSATVTLNEGANTFTIETTAEDGITKKTYTMTITRSISSNANLNYVSFGGGTSVNADIDNSKRTVTADVYGNRQQLYIGLSDSLSKLLLIDEDGTRIVYYPGITIDTGSEFNRYTIEVTAEDGTKKVYEVTINRKVSGNNKLSSVTFYDGTDAHINNTANTVTATVSGALQMITIMPENGNSAVALKDSLGNTIPYNDVDAASLNLEMGDNVFTIIITAENGEARTYQMTLHRVVSHEAGLSTIRIETPTGDETIYLDMSNSTEVSATCYSDALLMYIARESNNSTYELKDSSGNLLADSADSQQGIPINIVEGNNTFTITVTAEDGSTQKTYHISLVREVSSDATLNYISLYSGSEVYADIDNDVGFVSATVNGAAQIMMIHARYASSSIVLKDADDNIISYNPMDGAALNLSEGINRYLIEVTAEDGTKKTFPVEIDREISSDTSLASISVNAGGNYNNTFIITNVGHTESETVYGSQQDMYISRNAYTSTYRLKDSLGNVIAENTDSDQGIPLNLKSGVNTYTIEVTAEDGISKSTYQLDLLCVLSNEARLSDIRIDGKSLQDFNYKKYQYNYGKVDKDSIIVSATAKYKKSVISGDIGEKALAAGQNTIKITVTAEDGVTQKEYSIILSNKTYVVTVTNGTGGGDYVAGAVVTVTANTAPTGQQFKQWNISPSVTYTGGTNATSATAKFTMPEQAVTATAVYEPKPTPVPPSPPAVIPVGISCSKTDVTLFGAANGSITVSASGGNSGTFEYSISGGASWQSFGTYSGLAAGTYTAAVRDAGNRGNVAVCSVTIGQPALIGNVPANKVPSKAAVDTAITVTPPAAPKGYTPQSVTFTSSNPGVATVDANGNVTFLAGGKVTIITKVVSQTVDKKGKVKIKTTTVKKTITVNQLVEAISLNLTNTTVARTQKVSLTANIAPSTASNKKLTWKSSNPKVAAVSSSGVVTGKAGGTAIITCTAKDGSGASANCTVNVTPIYPTGLKMSKTALTVKLGKTAALKATIAPKNTDFKTLTWTSSNPAVAAVDAKGKIRALSSGTAVITATTSNGISASCTVTVP